MTDATDKAIRWDVWLGSVEIKTENRWEGSKLVGYGWSIHRDINGAITKTTKPEPGVVMDCSGMTLSDALYCVGRTGGAKGFPTVQKQTFLQKLFKQDPRL